MTRGPAGGAAPGTAVPELDTCGEDCATVTAAHPDARWLRNARYARWLAWASLGWMAAEGAVGLMAGFAAGSIALVGWALGSGIEALASVIVIWRFTGAADVVRNRRAAGAKGGRGQLLAAGPLRRDRGHPRPGRASPSQSHIAGHRPDRIEPGDHARTGPSQAPPR